MDSQLHYFVRSPDLREVRSIGWLIYPGTGIRFDTVLLARLGAVPSEPVQKRYDVTDLATLWTFHQNRLLEDPPPIVPTGDRSTAFDRLHAELLEEQQAIVNRQ